MLVLVSVLIAWMFLLMLGVGICRLASHSDSSDATAWHEWMTASDPLDADRADAELNRRQALQHPPSGRFRATG